MRGSLRVLVASMLIWLAPGAAPARADLGGELGKQLDDVLLAKVFALFQKNGAIRPEETQNGWSGGLSAVQRQNLFNALRFGSPDLHSEFYDYKGGDGKRYMRYWDGKANAGDRLELPENRTPGSEAVAAFLDEVATDLIAKRNLADLLAAAGQKDVSLRYVLTAKIAELQKVTMGSDNAYRLCEEIIPFVRRIQPPPALPDEAQRYMARGFAALQSADTADGFRNAAGEFMMATRSAPWFADAHYNLGVVQEKAGDFAEAIRSFNLYMLAAPDAADIQQTRNLVYQLEYRKEEAERLQAAAQSKQQTLAFFRLQVQGKTYESLLCSPLGPGNVPVGGRYECNEAEYAGNNWHNFGGVHEFRFPPDGRIELLNPYNGIIDAVGTPRETVPKEILWTDRDGKPIWTAFDPGMKTVVISPDRPPDNAGYSPSQRYTYQWFRARQ